MHTLLLLLGSILPNAISFMAEASEFLALTAQPVAPSLACTPNRATVLGLRREIHASQRGSPGCGLAQKLKVQRSKRRNKEDNANDVIHTCLVWRMHEAKPHRPPSFLLYH